MTKWVGEVELNSCPDWEELEAAKSLLEGQGATSIRAYVSVRQGKYGDTHIVTVNGYKE